MAAQIRAALLDIVVGPERLGDARPIDAVSTHEEKRQELTGFLGRAKRLFGTIEKQTKISEES
jgi:hypothetical protein